MALVACGRQAPPGGTPVEPVRPLAVFATQRLVVVPTGRVRADSLGWVAPGSARQVARQLDSALALVLDDRGLAQRWVLPAALVRTFERNRSYAADPYLLSIEPVRSPKFVTGERYGEPLSSQLRTMVALEQDTRFVLMPIELRYEAAGATARGVLKLALLDPRLAQAVWVGDVAGGFASTPAAAHASVASRIVDLFVAP